MMAQRFLALGVVALTLLSGRASAANEEAQLALESQIQQKIESILSKTLPPNSYIVTVKVEMESKPRATQARAVAERRNGANPFLTSSNFMLPGVPQKKDFVQTQDAAPVEAVTNNFADEARLRRLSITILVAPDISAEQIRGVREFISSSIPFNPLRGDDMVIQNSNLLKPTTTPAADPTTAIDPAALTPTSSAAAPEQRTERVGMPVLFLLGALTLLSVTLLAFLFGPVRAFLNRLLTVLPRVGEQAAAYAASNNGPKASDPVATSSMNGSMSQNHNGNQSIDTSMPFHFVREDQLSKLPILFRQMSAPQAALVLAYLPPQWASRVLGGLSTEDQTAIMAELAQAQEVPPEIVQDVESQVKSKLPYLVGGVDWIQSVYQHTQPQTQKALLGTLNQQSPELAESLRRTTFFFEDISAVNAGALRLIVQDAGYPTIASALKEEKADFRDGLLRRLPPAMREILQQELELSRPDRVASADAKARVVVQARRLLADGRISLPERKL